jgi:prepilin-type N-terminal cleavage/methylation domain-containing protein
MQPRRGGFTLIELMLVMLVIGLLAVIALPNYWKTRERAYFTSMKSDLKNLMTMQELYHSKANMYGGPAGTSAAAVTGLDYNPSQGVTVTIREADARGWSADAAHAGLNAAIEKCSVYVGMAAVLPPASSMGIIECIGE